MTRSLTATILLGTCLTFACGGGAPSPAPPPPAGGATPPAAAPPTTAPAAATTAGEIGVPVCDEYITKYEACVRDHVPAAQKPMVEQALQQYRTTWRSAAAQPAARASLADACQQALTAARASMSVYGCKW